MFSKEMRNRIILIVVLLSFTVPTFAQSEWGRQPDRNISIHLDRKPLFTVLWTLIQKHDVAIGFEESTLDRDHRHYEFEVNRAVKESTLKEYSDRVMDPPVPAFRDHLITVNFDNVSIETVLDSVVSQMKHYTWEMNDSVVNIVPKAGRDERLKNLMDVRVKLFYLAIGDTADTIQPRLVLFNPELKSFLGRNGLSVETAQRVTFFDEMKFPDGLDLRDLTFRELLNRLTKLKRGGWAVRIKNSSDEPGKEYLEIDI